MVKIKKIDHVAVCVTDVDEAAALWQRLFDLRAGPSEYVDSQKTDALLLPMGETSLELVSPRGGNEGLERFLHRRGPGLHHVAVEVEGIVEAIATLLSLGVPMIDLVPRRGARGHQVAFVHPKATGGVLVELIERQGHP